MSTSTSDRASNSTGGGSSHVQIGHYVLGETLGIGTFGKVKGIVSIFMSMPLQLETCSSLSDVGQ